MVEQGKQVDHGQVEVAQAVRLMCEQVSQKEWPELSPDSNQLSDQQGVPEECGPACLQVQRQSSSTSASLQQTVRQAAERAHLILTLERRKHRRRRRHQLHWKPDFLLPLLRLSCRLPRLQARSDQR